MFSKVYAVKLKLRCSVHRKILRFVVIIAHAILYKYYKQGNGSPNMLNSQTSDVRITAIVAIKLIWTMYMYEQLEYGKC